MTRILQTSLLLCGVLALSACGGGSDAGHGDEAGHGGGHKSSSAGLPDGRIAEGEQLAAAKGAATGQSCVDCHGAEGNAPLDPTYPRLGGQYQDYIAHALQAYRSGAREHALMSSQARDLDDQQIADLAAYFASRPTHLVNLQGIHDGE
jgi:cytochrome c553